MISAKQWEALQRLRDRAGTAWDFGSTTVHMLRCYGLVKDEAGRHGKVLALTEAGRWLATGGPVVFLSAGPNPDLRQYGDIGVPDRVVPVTTLRAAVEAVREYIDEHDLGFGNWTGGQVHVGQRQIAQISYNGRVWEPGRYPQPEITALDEEVRA